MDRLLADLERDLTALEEIVAAFEIIVTIEPGSFIGERVDAPFELIGYIADPQPIWPGPPHDAYPEVRE